MSTSRFGAVVDSLVTMCGSVSGLTVYDGPTISGDRPTAYVVVGGTEDPDEDAGEFTQDWNGLGARAKQETGEVVCALLVWTGDDGVKSTRDAALTHLASIENLVRADPTLAGAVISGWCHISSGQPSQRRNTEGLYVRIRFTVAYQSHV